MRLFPTLHSGLLAATVLFAPSCGSSGSVSAADFAVDSVNVLEGQEWRLNRAIEIAFTEDVDFATVSLNTISIENEQGQSAVGFFSQPTAGNGKPDRRRVLFQPRCPTREDHSDAGLSIATKYRLSVLGSQFKAATVRSASGEPLEVGVLVSFHTPDSDDPQVLFLDPVPGPPAVRLRGTGPTGEATTHLSIGGQRAFFVLDTDDQQGELEGDLAVPLNHYSIAENRVSAVVHFDQPVAANAENISGERLGFQYADGADWVDFATDVELIENCTETGAAVRLTPRGLLPRERAMRLVVKEGFSDLIGSATLGDRDRFAVMWTSAAGGPNELFPETDNPAVDEVLDVFHLSDAHPGSLEDTASDDHLPRAAWGGGELAASFDFEGTGGPEGTFDWHIETGTIEVLDTVFDQIDGGPQGVPTDQQTVVNGVVDIRNLWVKPNSTLIIVGPNTARILASGFVRVEGEISIRGSDNTGVASLDTTTQPENGAKGQAGGGDGGTGSFLTTTSTPAGGRGNGAFNLPGGGGGGGEASFATTGKDDRRGAGGGGGRFGPDVFYDFDLESGSNPLVRCQTLIGLDAEHGALGGPGGTSAVTKSGRAQGGAVGPSPFFDASSANDHLGFLQRASGQVIAGELDRVWAGAGGGGGGDAANTSTFPEFPFQKAGDEKGAGGGGGAGGLEILAIGPVEVGTQSALALGSIAAEGGDGGGGENTNGFDRVGGGSGGGSGGHIVLSSAASITVHGRGETAQPWYGDSSDANAHSARPLSAVGGEGGAGHASQGGSNENGSRQWRVDHIPFAFFEGLTNVPPHHLQAFQNLVDFADKLGGPVVGAGGDGSPGRIQLHAPAGSLFFPALEREQGLSYEGGLDVTPVCAPPPVGWHAPGEVVDRALPFFGRRSRSQSKWIPLGLARALPGGELQQVVLRFEGTDGGGHVPHQGADGVDQLEPILGPDPLGTPDVPPFLDADGTAVVFDARALVGADTVYRENPALLRAFSVQLEDSADPDNVLRVGIACATYDAQSERLTCHLSQGGKAVHEFAAGGDILVALVPHFLRMSTAGTLDLFPPDTDVLIDFDATRADPVGGAPSPDSHGFTTDISELSLDPEWDFFRFRIEFDLDNDGDGVGLGAARPALDHLRVSFRF